MRAALITFGIMCLSMPATAEEGSGSRLNLVCLGGGSANQRDSANVQFWSSDGDHGSANIVGNSRVPFDDQVNLWIDGDEGQLRMPRVMLPVVRGGEDGWFRVADIEVSDGEIRGEIRVNVINRPKLRIDRYTGAISIQGKAGSYVGRCQAYEPENTAKRF